jgi:hypothetical protein
MLAAKDLILVEFAAVTFNSLKTSYDLEPPPT